MADKGGKGLTQSKSKSAASLKGKDDSSTKSKKGKKVQFSSEDSSSVRTNILGKSGGKTDTSFGKGDLGKGGKGDKVGSGGKSPAAPALKPPPPLELKVEQELPENATCLMDCEAAQILEGIQEQMVLLSADPTIKIPIPFDRGLKYAKRGCHYTNPQSVRQTLETLKQHGVSDSEICMISNVCPESIEEIFSLVRSFKGKKSKLKEPLKNALDSLTKLRR